MRDRDFCLICPLSLFTEAGEASSWDAAHLSEWSSIAEGKLASLKWVGLPFQVKDYHFSFLAILQKRWVHSHLIPISILTNLGSPISICLSIYLSTHPSIHPPTYLSVYLNLSLFFYLYLFLSLSPFIFLFLHFYTFLYLYSNLNQYYLSLLLYFSISLSLYFLLLILCLFPIPAMLFL